MNITDILQLIDKWETRLVAMGPHDNQRCHGLYLKVFPDGSGSVMAHYCDVKNTDGEDNQLIRTVTTMTDTELFGFDTLAELHGELVAKTMTTMTKLNDFPSPPPGPVVEPPPQEDDEWDDEHQQ